MYFRAVYSPRHFSTIKKPREILVERKNFAPALKMKQCFLGKFIPHSIPVQWKKTKNPSGAQKLCPGPKKNRPKKHCFIFRAGGKFFALPKDCTVFFYCAEVLRGLGTELQQTCSDPNLGTRNEIKSADAIKKVFLVKWRGKLNICHRMFFFYILPISRCSVIVTRMQLF